MKTTDLTKLTACLLVLAGCTVRSEPGEEVPAPAEPPEGPSSRIEIPTIVRDNLGLTFATVEARRISQTLRVPGSFELQPRARRQYHMALPGRVELLVDQYDDVEEGQVLFRFQSPAWPELLHEVLVGEQAMATARADIAVAEARLAETRRNHELATERITTLANADVRRADLELEAARLAASLPRLEAELAASRTRLDNARRTREHALHRAAAAKGIESEELEAPTTIDGRTVPTYETIDWIEVHAVHAGVVEELFVTDGAFVEPPGLVTSVVDPTRVRFRALAAQDDLVALRSVDVARIVPPQIGTVLESERDVGPDVDATLTVGLEAHPHERTLTLLATPRAHRPWIRPGVAAFLEVVVDSTASPVLAVPRSAVVQDGLQHVFFRRSPSEPNVAIRVEADLGATDGRWIELKSGVMRGDEVVLAGAYELTLATRQARTSSGSGHVHADGSTHEDH